MASWGSSNDWLRSGNLRSLRPEAAIHEYSFGNGRPRLVRGWSERNGETVCRLYERSDGKRDLLLCRFQSSAVRGLLGLFPGAPLPGKRSIDQQSDLVRAGVKCSVHGDEVLAFLLPAELASCAEVALSRVVDAADRGNGSLGWCVTGAHEVVAPGADP